MFIFRAIQELFRSKKPFQVLAHLGSGTTRCFLNVGGGNKTISTPDHFKDWTHLLLDIDPSSGADIILDARDLATLPASLFDAVYCSHNLEHYYQHDVAKVLAGFLHVLKPDGFAEIHVPDMHRLMHHFVAEGSDINDVLYEAAAGPISFHDVIYGWGKQIQASGVDYYAHKTGFTVGSLQKVLLDAGFSAVWLNDGEADFAIGALAFKHSPNPSQRATLNLPALR
jgi:SAM-dependent methyltransferase